VVGDIADCHAELQKRLSEIESWQEKDKEARPAPVRHGRRSAS
jgi:hypothetical protein